MSDTQPPPKDRRSIHEDHTSNPPAGSLATITKDIVPSLNDLELVGKHDEPLANSVNAGLSDCITPHTSPTTPGACRTPHTNNDRRNLVQKQDNLLHYYSLLPREFNPYNTHIEANTHSISVRPSFLGQFTTNDPSCKGAADNNPSPVHPKSPQPEHPRPNWTNQVMNIEQLATCTPKTTASRTSWDEVNLQTHPGSGTYTLQDHDYVGRLYGGNVSLLPRAHLLDKPAIPSIQTLPPIINSVVQLEISQSERDYHADDLIMYVSKKYQKVFSQLRKHSLVENIIQSLCDLDWNGELDRLYTYRIQPKIQFKSLYYNQNRTNQQTTLLRNTTPSVGAPMDTSAEQQPLVDAHPFNSVEAALPNMKTPQIFTDCLFFVTGKTTVPLSLLNILISSCGGRIVLSVGLLGMYQAQNKNLVTYIIGDQLSSSRFGELAEIQRRFTKDQDRWGRLEINQFLNIWDAFDKQSSPHHNKVKNSLMNCETNQPALFQPRDSVTSNQEYTTPNSQLDMEKREDFAAVWGADGIDNKTFPNPSNLNTNDPTKCIESVSSRASHRHAYKRPDLVRNDLVKFFLTNEPTPISQSRQEEQCSAAVCAISRDNCARTDSISAIPTPFKAALKEKRQLIASGQLTSTIIKRQRVTTHGRTDDTNVVALLEPGGLTASIADDMNNILPSQHTTSFTDLIAPRQPTTTTNIDNAGPISQSKHCDNPLSVQQHLQPLPNQHDIGQLNHQHDYGPPSNKPRQLLWCLKERWVVDCSMFGVLLAQKDYCYFSQDK